MVEAPNTVAALAVAYAVQREAARVRSFCGVLVFAFTFARMRRLTSWCQGSTATLKPVREASQLSDLSRLPRYAARRRRSMIAAPRMDSGPGQKRAINFSISSQVPVSMFATSSSQSRCRYEFNTTYRAQLEEKGSSSAARRPMARLRNCRTAGSPVFLAC